jgi:hypothetical protein
VSGLHGAAVEGSALWPHQVLDAASAGPALTSTVTSGSTMSTRSV